MQSRGTLRCLPSHRSCLLRRVRFSNHRALTAPSAGAAPGASAQLCRSLVARGGERGSRRGRCAALRCRGMRGDDPGAGAAPRAEEADPPRAPRCSKLPLLEVTATAPGSAARVVRGGSNATAGTYERRLVPRSRVPLHRPSPPSLFQGNPSGWVLAAHRLPLISPLEGCYLLGGFQNAPKGWENGLLR